MRPTIPASLAAAVLVFGAIGCGGSSTSAVPVCTDATTCPAPSGPCQVAACVGGACGFTFKVTGTKVSNPTVGDCRATVCDGAGNVMVAVDDTDVPSAAGQCSDGVCVAGVPGQSDKPIGTACSSSGGTMCDGAGACVQCVGGGDCASGVCAAGTCQAPSCADGVKNGTETAVDCGGLCPACSDGKGCGVGSDCQSGVCSGATCQAPTCNDGVKNGLEPSVDCGGGTCPACQDGKACLANGDCQSNACLANVCAKSQGITCGSNGECGTGNCIDGVCCDTPCSGSCVQCNAPGLVGVCSNAVAGSDPRNACIDAGAPSCLNTGYCSGAGSCALYSSGTFCAAAFCSGSSSLTQAGTCSGVGVCNAGAVKDCAPYLCSNSSCKTSCTVNADCVGGTICGNGSCQVTPVCGDGVVGFGEQCDLGAANGTTCCTTSCTLVAPAVTCP
jgi:hypothetical protein